MIWNSKGEVSRPDDLRRSNVRAVLATLRGTKNLSRTDIARLSGLSAATVSTIVSGLIDDGYVEPATLEDDAISTRRGRPQVVLALRPQAAKIATIALSLNAMIIALYDYSGMQVAIQESQIDTAHSDGLVQRVAKGLDDILAASNIAQSDLVHIALGVQGVTDVARRSMVWAPITAQPIDFAAALEKIFNVAATVSNDCDMIAVAIANERNAQLGQDFAVVTLSRGIGMSIVRGGSVIAGVTSSAAEFGHIVYRHDGAKCRCGQTGCIEAYAGDYAIWRHALEQDEALLPQENIAREAFAALFQAAQSNDGAERAAFQRAGKALGVGLRSVFAMLDRLPIVFVGFGAIAAEILEPEIRQINAANTMPINQGKLTLEWRRAARPLIIEGCALTALGAVDDTFAFDAFR